MEIFSAPVWKRGLTAAQGQFSTPGRGQLNAAHAQYRARRSSVRNDSQPDILSFLSLREGKLFLKSMARYGI